MLTIVEYGDVTPCILVKVGQILEEVYCLHVQGGNVSQANR
jgi:hypothetical protein